jgi:UDP-glucose 4-epimerase
MESERTGEVINIASGVPTSIRELAEMLIEIVGSGVEPIFEPREVLVSRRQADITLASEVLGWKPEIPLREGLVEVVERVKREEL